MSGLGNDSTATTKLDATTGSEGDEWMDARSAEDLHDEDEDFHADAGMFAFEHDGHAPQHDDSVSLAHTALTPLPSLPPPPCPCVPHRPALPTAHCRRVASRHLTWISVGGCGWPRVCRVAGEGGRCSVCVTVCLNLSVQHEFTWVTIFIRPVMDCGQIAALFWMCGTWPCVPCDFLGVFLRGVGLVQPLDHTRCPIMAPMSVTSSLRDV